MKPPTQPRPAAPVQSVPVPYPLLLDLRREGVPIGLKRRAAMRKKAKRFEPRNEEAA